MTTMNIEYAHTRLLECAKWPGSSSNSKCCFSHDRPLYRCGGVAYDSDMSSGQVK